MKLALKTPLIAAVAAVVLGLSGVVQAGGGGRHHDDHGYYGKHSQYHYNRHYEPRRHYKRHRNNDNDELLIGLLFGGLVGYAIGDARQADVHRYNSYPPASAAPPPVSYPPQVSYPAPQPVYDSHGSCLQEREYQTKVIIGGRQVDAYGTACLQPDGSWRRGPAQAAAY